MRTVALPWLWLLMVWLAPSQALGAPSASNRARAALSVLQSECFACHGEKRKGGLDLSSRESVLKGGDDGPAVTPGKPDASRLLALLQPGADPHMPPRKQLAPEQIRALRDWIQSGLAWDASALDDAIVPEPVTLEALPGTYRPVTALALSPDGQRLAVGRGGRLILHDLSRTNRPVLGQVAAHPDAIQSLAWSPDGRRLLSGAFRSLRSWDPTTLQPVFGISNGLSGRVTAMAFDADGSRLAIADGGGGRAGWIRILEPSNGRIAGGWKAHRDTVFSLQFSPDGTRLLSAGGDQLVKVWAASNHAEIAVLEGHTAQVLSAAFNTNATQVVSGGADRQLKVWDIATREKIVSLGNHVAGITAVVWPTNGLAVFAVTEKGEVFRYTQLKAHTGEQSSVSADERRLGGLDSAALSLVVSPDGQLIHAGDHDGSVAAWTQDGKFLGVLDFPEPPVPLVVAAGAPVRRSLPATPVGHGETNRAVLAALRALKVDSLSVEPASLELTPDSPRRGFRVTGRTPDGFEVDLTSSVRVEIPRKAGFERVGEGEIALRPGSSPGQWNLRVRQGRQEAVLPVRTAVAAVEPSPSFVRDVLPLLSQAGCAAGGCHAKPEGQNGFKLSVFSFDPKADYAEMVKEDRGRRIFPAAPDESLILQKALGRIPHEGGQRFAPGSPTHRRLEAWIRAGMPYVATNEPALVSLRVFPAARRLRKGASQRLLVEAGYADGSVRDVTGLAAFESNDPELARVESGGRVVLGSLPGQGVVVARYMGLVADSQILVPAEKLLPPEEYAALPVNNAIDSHAYARFQELGLKPSAGCTDAEFLRRATLDTLGRVPGPEEVRTFLADPDPDRRRKLADRLLEDPAYADHWANKWTDLLRPNPDRVGVKSVFLLDQWIREQFRRNVPYDQFVRAILTAEGSNHRDGPAVIYRDRREPAELTTMFSQLFLGTRLECAKCHHHPNEKWSQEDFYRLAAYFGPVKQKGAGLSPPISAGSETFYFAPGGTVAHPVTGEVLTPRPPDGPAPEGKTGDPRVALADWLTAPGNPFFARAAVNRVWAAFFGRGLVQPVDDFRLSNPGANTALLDALARDFEAHHFDLKHLIRTLLGSRLYQLGSEPNGTNLGDTRAFSRAYRRRLPAEVLLDAVCDITGVLETFSALPPGGRANQAWSYKIESHFLDAFGRPNSSSDCPCERDQQLSVVQSLHVMNSRALQSKLSSDDGRVARLAGSASTPAQIVEELYLAALGRFPTPAESDRATAVYAGTGASRRAATEDLLWALLNSPEFLLNH
jgi:WD40 repeat protein